MTWSNHPRNAARRAAIASAVWAVAFAIPSFYWALGGDIGSRTIARDIDDIPLANNSLIVALTGVLKLLAGVMPVALVSIDDRSWLRRPLKLVIWVIGGFLLLYGVANGIDHALMVTGIIATPETLGTRASHWHLALWDPVWIIGGLCFLATARAFRRRV